jgi:hypothetical protein
MLGTGLNTRFGTVVAYAAVVILDKHLPPSHDMDTVRTNLYAFSACDAVVVPVQSIFGNGISKPGALLNDLWKPK